MGKQGQTATNKDNNISKMIALHYCHISPNVACFFKLMAQNWHKNFALVRACSDYFLRSPIDLMNEHRPVARSTSSTTPMVIGYSKCRLCSLGNILFFKCLPGFYILKKTIHRKCFLKE